MVVSYSHVVTIGYGYGLVNTGIGVWEFASMPHTENKFQTIDKRRRSALAELAALVQLGVTPGSSFARGKILAANGTWTATVTHAQYKDQAAIERRIEELSR
jgi:hypothetical protein